MVIIALVSVLQPSSATAELLQVSPGFNQIISPYLEYVIDSDREITIEGLRQGQINDQTFSRYLGPYTPALGDSIWYRLHLANPSTEHQTVILDLNEFMFDELDIYQVNREGQIQGEYHLGLSRSNAPPFAYRFAAVPLELGANTRSTVFIHYRTTNFILFQPILSDALGFAINTHRDASISNLFAGIIAGILLYVLLVVANSREFSISAYYLGYLTYSLLMLLYCNGYLTALIDTAPWLKIRLHGILLGLLALTFLLFSWHYLKPRESLPWSPWIFHILMGSSLLFTAVTLTPLVQYSTQVGLYNSAIIMVTMIILALMIWYRTGRAMPAYLMGNVSLLSLTLLANVNLPALSDLRSLARHAYELGLCLQDICFALAVSGQIRLYRQERELLHHQAELAQAESRAKSEFLAKMSHEIRTPMNGVLGMVELLRDTPLNQQQKQLTNTIHSSGKALLAILNDILDYSKVSSGKLELENTRFNLRELISQTFALYGHQALQKNLNYRLELSDDLPEFVQGDATRLQQILSNLISNATKFTDTGEVLVNARLSDNRKQLCFTITDTGIGLHRGEAEQLFSNFHQADASISRRYGGSGLGLAICKQLVHLMGGQIGVSSLPAQGSTFWFTISHTPAAPLNLMDDTEAASSECFPGVYVLVVEDNPVNQQVLNGFLTKLGVKADIVSDGEQAMALVRCQHHQYALVFMDCEMPVLDGYETTQAIRQLERDKGLSRLPVVALTAHAELSYQQRCFAAGMDDHLSKPVNRQQIATLLRRHLGGGNKT